MGKSNHFEQQVRQNLPKLDARPEFGADRLWLTFYLMGPPENLRQVSGTLNARGWVNVDGWEGAFLYPKVQTEKSAEAVVEVAEATQELCARHEVEILNIDADTSPDVERSRFVTLYHS
jgi:hypothetical protein